MEKNYALGRKTQFAPEDASFTNKEEAISQAKKAGLGFIVQFSTKEKNKKIYHSVLAWDVRIMSYAETKQNFADNPEIMETLKACKKTEIFIISDSNEGIFAMPFKADFYKRI